MVKEGDKPTWKNKKFHFMNFPNAVVAFGIALLLISSTIMIAPVPTSAASPIDSRSIVWDVQLNCTEPSGRNDNVLFGEAPDANDGGSPDSYDAPKPPAPFPPYIRAWFDDNLPTPYDKLYEDFRKYPDVYKVWNLTVKWENSSFVYIPDITISWNTTDVDDSEYDVVELWNTTAKVADMLTEGSYTYTQGWIYIPPPVNQYFWIDASFQIICTIIPNNPPTFSGESPSDGSTDVSIGTSSLGIYIEDPDGDNFNWTIETSPDVGSSSSSGASNGTKTCSITGLAYSTTYTWFVNATDGEDWTNESYTFTTESAPPPPNNPPTFSGESPSDGSTDVSIGMSSLGIYIEDPDGDNFNWTIETSPDVGSSSSSGASNGTKTCSITGLAYSTTYTWFVNATDGEDWTNESYSFTTAAPVPVTVWGYVYVNDVITDPDQVSLTFPGNSPLLADLLGSGGYKIDFNADGLVGETGTFEVVVSGMTFNANETIYISGAGSYPINLTVNISGPPVFFDETPSDGSPGVSIGTSPISITIQDPEGNSFNWSITTIPDIGNSSGSGDNNGTKTCSISGLAYSTTYMWLVNTTDGTGWRNISYSFTTESAPPPGPGPGGPGPGPGPTNQPPTADANGPYSGFIDEEITFDGSGSTDDGSITNYTWDFGDGAMGYGVNPVHTYSNQGRYYVSLTVIDNLGATDTNETIAEIITANRIPSAPVIEGSQKGTQNQEYAYIAVSTDEDNDTIQYHFNWDDGTTNTTEFLPNGTATTQMHIWIAAGIYTISVQAYDNQTPSDTTRHTVLIDAHIVDDIGYITDDDADGTYDTFHDTDLETDLGQESGKYLIDDDGDGEWDYVYNLETEELTEYEGEPTPHDENYTNIIIIIIVIIIILIILFIIVKRKRG